MTSIVDKDGIAWYSNFGEQNLGRLDPKTGKVTEYPVPEHKPGFPTGFLALRADQRRQSVARQHVPGHASSSSTARPRNSPYWPLPKEQNIDAAQVNMVSPQSSHVDGKVWAQNNGFAGIHRLDLATGKIETWEPFKDAKEPHNIYDVIPNSKNNVFFTDFRLRHIGRIDAKTGEVKMFEVPTRRLGAAPRPDGCAGPAVVRAVPRRPHRACSTPRPRRSRSGGCRRAGRRPMTCSSTRTRRPGPARC